MKYYELTNTIYLFKDVYFTKMNEIISKFINKALYLDKELSKFHVENEFKGYVFDSLYPREKDKVYKEGSIYVFRIRSIDEKLMKKLGNLLKKVNSKDMKLIATEKKEYKQRHITSVYTATPAVVTLEKGYWTQDKGIELLMDRIRQNTIKKYKHLYGNDIEYEYDFIQGIELENNKPIAINYKNIKLLGNKFNLTIKDDELSQKLAFILMSTGILEKNSSVGAGYCIAKFL